MRRPRITLWLLRAALTLHALVAVGQPLLIGGYLDGSFDMLGIHRGNGSALPGYAFLGTLAAVGYAVVGGGRWHPVPATLTMVLLEGVQAGVGFARVLAVHVPLGVLVVTGAIVLAIWSWTPRARLPRAARAAVEAAAGPAVQVTP
jgi:hypothetical protein